MFLIVIDAHSKWPDVFHMTSTTATATVKTLRTLFACQGIPNEVVSDNGPQFVAAEFKQFMAQNGIRHITSAPYHPRTNRQADRFVQFFKRAIKSADSHKSATFNQTLCTFLFKYRTTPHATTNETPSMRMYGRNIRSRLDLVKPNTANCSPQEAT
jgi:transposase InsO family protein